MEKLFIFFILVYHQTTVMGNLKRKFAWKVLDLEYPNEQKRLEAIELGDFIPEENIPIGIDSYRDKIFVTIPRWSPGVPVTLAYINKNDTQTAPKLRPYPDWESQNLQNPYGIISAFRVRVDNCQRLWIVDIGLDAFNITTRRLLVFDLTDDSLLRSYIIPDELLYSTSFFSTLAVEDKQCNNSFAYLGDFGFPGIIVYSWQQNHSWRISHNYFHIDPLAGEITVDGDILYWDKGVFGMALSKPGRKGMTTLYFHPLTSTHEFSVYTFHLKDNQYELQKHYKRFRDLGSRGPDKQSGASFCDQKTGVLFYTLLSQNAIGCWNTRRDFSEDTQDVVYQDNSMIYPNDIKVDAYDVLWVLSNRYSKFTIRHTTMPGEINFGIYTGYVPKLINNTLCDPNHKSEATGVSSTLWCTLVMIIIRYVF